MHYTWSCRYWTSKVMNQVEWAVWSPSASYNFDTKSSNAKLCFDTPRSMEYFVE